MDLRGSAFLSGQVSCGKLRYRSTYPAWEENKPAALYLINWTQLPPTPLPDIKANGSDGPITIPYGTNLTVTITLAPGSHDGEDADWWVVGGTPFGLFWYTLDKGWVRSDAPIRVYGGPFFDLLPFEVLNISGLPVGAFTFYFGVDLLMNGSLDFGELYFDSVDVTIE